MVNRNHRRVDHPCLIRNDVHHRVGDDGQQRTVQSVDNLRDVVAANAVFPDNPHLISGRSTDNSRLSRAGVDDRRIPASTGNELDSVVDGNVIQRGSPASVHGKRSRSGREFVQAASHAESRAGALLPVSEDKHAVHVADHLFELQRHLIVDLIVKVSVNGGLNRRAGQRHVLAENLRVVVSDFRLMNRTISGFAPLFFRVSDDVPRDVCRSVRSRPCSSVRGNQRNGNRRAAGAVDFEQLRSTGSHNQRTDFHHRHFIGGDGQRSARVARRIEPTRPNAVFQPFKFRGGRHLSRPDHAEQKRAFLPNDLVGLENLPPLVCPSVTVSRHFLFLLFFVIYSASFASCKDAARRSR